MLTFTIEDKPLIEKVYGETVQALRKYAYSRLNDAQLAADVVQQSVLDFMESFHNISFLSEEKLRGYLYKITVNNVYDVLRVRSRQAAAEDISACSELPERALSTEDFVLGQIGAQEIRRNIEKLQPRYALYLQMKYVDELDAAQIAKVLKVKPDSLRMLEYRAKRHLKQILEESETMAT